MKKVFVLSAVLALVTISCSKECECKTIVSDKVISTELIELEDGDCEDLNQEVNVNGSVLSGYKCD